MSLIAVRYIAHSVSLFDLAEQVSRIDPEEFRSVDAIAFLCEFPLDFDLDASKSTLAYALEKPVFIVRFEPQLKSHSINHVTQNCFVETKDDALLSRIRARDLELIVNSSESNCALESGDGFHFITPSLNHTTRFLRIADSITSKEALQRISFWLRSFTISSDAILVDHWSIAAPIIASLQKDNHRISYDCLPDHPASNEEACRRIVFDITEQIPEGGTLGVINSICGSGQLVKFIDKIFSEISGRNVFIKIVNIYGFESSPGDCVCWNRIPDKGQTFRPQECLLCKEGSIPIPLDGANYHLRTSIETPVNLSISHFTSSRAFIERYRAVPGLFRLHRNDPNDGRHHAFDLDVDTLLSTVTFLTRLRSAIENFRGKIDLIVVPNHSAGRSMGGIAAEMLQASILVHDTLDRVALNVDDLKLLSQSRHVLLIDDVINSGSRLRRYIQSIREGVFDGFDRIHYLVGVARSRTKKELNAQEGLLKKGHSWAGEFIYVESIFLPRYKEIDCPWCKEFDFLSRLATRLDRPPDWLSKRMAMLRDTKNGLSEEALLLLPGVAKRTVGADSPIFFEGTDSVVTAFQLASGFQELRSDPNVNLRLAPGFPLGTVLAPSNVSDRYTEGLLRALLLRVATKQEWGSVTAHKTQEALLAVAEEKSQDVILGELLLVWGRKGLPTTNKEAFVKIYEQNCGELVENISEVLNLTANSLSKNSDTFASSDYPSSIFDQVLGESWLELPRPIRKLHSVNETWTARVWITKGMSWIARRLFRIPMGDRSRSCIEVAIRTFSEPSHSSIEFELCNHSCEVFLSVEKLIELRFDFWRIEMTVRTFGGALILEQNAVFVSVTGIWLRLPSFLTPYIKLSEEAVDSERVGFRFDFVLPFSGLLFAIEGQLEAQHGKS